MPPLTLSKRLFKTKYSEANSYYGSQQTEKQTKLDIFTLGTDMAKEAVVLLTGGDPYSTVPKDPNHRSALALAHYWAAANLGQWADTRGPLHSLGQWPNLEKHLAAIIANDESTEEYGAYRIWGRGQDEITRIQRRFHRRIRRILSLCLQ